ncbi:hypothetical protein FH589_01290 [Leptospira interrogans]|uniref:hypothetical protein n=1 Tax=Leptospira interrogans TaxID=173 RepID=UPI00165F3CE1|nr:hypothetical protein [Leptospira interrogans]ULG82274.1 hypothetical protein FH595_18625 [Leptospira interrogans]UML67161.1 hypothetical protein FH589_01290 [Leptospira interrogans]UML74157.1 hypothetical protein FH598_18960 [Leptospira interrogans]
MNSEKIQSIEILNSLKDGIDGPDIQACKVSKDRNFFIVLHGGTLSTKAVSVWRIAFAQVQKVSTIPITEKNIRNPRIHVSENYNILIYYESGYLKFKLSTEGILSLESSYQGGKGWALAVLKENVIFYYSNYYDNTEYKSKKQFRLHDVSSHEEDKSLVNDGFNSAWVVDAAIHNDSVIFTGDEELFVFNVSNFKSPKGIFKQKIKNSKWKFVSHAPWIVCETEYHVSSAFHLLNEVGKKFEISNSVLRNRFVRAFDVDESNRIWAIVSNESFEQSLVCVFTENGELKSGSVLLLPDTEGHPNFSNQTVHHVLEMVVQKDVILIIFRSGIIAKITLSNN